jgi:hypothetical protein
MDDEGGKMNKVNALLTLVELFFACAQAIQHFSR